MPLFGPEPPLHAALPLRRIALYPGAFRPPHAAHVHAVHALLQRRDIDEVVVIVSNRCRPVPGTTRVLGADVAEKIWGIYLRGFDTSRVRVEMASETAIRHALEYFHRVPPGSTLYFCLGEADFASGDPRFQSIAELAERTGIAASIIAAPTGGMTVRGTDVRAALGQREAGRHAFLAALPDYLTETERQDVWELCRANLKAMSEVLAPTIRTIVERQALGPLVELRPVRSEKLDPVFVARYLDGRQVFVKYAGDTAEAGTMGDPRSLKPRKRLFVERRALVTLQRIETGSILVPDVLFFDKRTWTLELSEVCPGGRTLAEACAHGVFDVEVAKRLGQWLARCHGLGDAVPPLWGDDAADRRQWARMLALRTVEAASALSDSAIHQRLHELSRDSVEVRGLLHLDLSPKNIVIAQEAVGVIDWESASSIGDPACDLGWLLGSYVIGGRMTSAARPCRAALAALIRAYRDGTPLLWPHIADRVPGFAGAAIVAAVQQRLLPIDPCLETELLGTARWLLTDARTTKATLEMIMDHVTGAS